MNYYASWVRFGWIYIEELPVSDMATNSTKIGVGAVLLLISSVLILSTGVQGLNLPVLGASIAALGLAAGALLVGTSEEGRPV
jgi:hypothetical protein